MPNLKKKAMKPNDPTLPVAPLVVNGSSRPEIDLGRVFTLVQRFFGVEIENPTDKDIKYTNIVVNCNCTSIVNKIPKSGVIKAHSKLPLKLRLNAADLRKETFFRMIRFELDGYQHFQINFTGKLSKDMEMVFGDDPKKLPRKKITVGYIEDASKPWQTVVSLQLKGEAKEKLELTEIKCTKNFVAALHHINEQAWGIEIHGVNPMERGPLKDAVMARLVSPAPPKGQVDVVMLPIVGICGTRIMPSIDTVYNDPKQDSQIVKKRFALTREPFIDAFSLAQMARGRGNPYKPHIKRLNKEEVVLPKVKGVTFSLEQGSGGVYVDCTLDRSQMTEEGEEADFKAGQSLECVVRFAVLGEKERAELEKAAAEEKRQEEEQKAFELEQNNFLKTGEEPANEKK